MSQLVGIEILKRRLNQKKSRVNLRYDYYEMKKLAQTLDIAVPKELDKLRLVLGWCGLAVDSLADRVIFKDFKDDDFNMNEIFKMNNPDILFDSAVLSAMISSCCFIYIVKGADGYPIMDVIDGSKATGVMDPTTGMLSEGYAVLDTDKDGNTLTEAYFVPGMTWYNEKGVGQFLIQNEAPYPLLVPIIHRPDARRVFGHSRISRACMKIQESAIRTMARSEISAEFYSYPQKWVTGLDQDAELMDKWKSAISMMMMFTKDDQGDSPTLGQFTQQSMTPHNDQLKMFAGQFAAETGLCLNDLGFETDNPSSAEAIKASHENLRLKARKAQRNFGTGFLNAGYLAACVRDDKAYNRSEIYRTKPTWEPIFEPDAAMMSSIGDGAIKINQAIPGYFGKENMRELTGIEGENDE